MQPCNFQKINQEAENSANNTDTTKIEVNTNEDINVEERIEQKEEIDHNVCDNEPKKAIVSEGKNTKTSKFLNLFKNILNSFKSYLTNRKNNKEARKLEKEKLKTIPKKVQRSQIQNKTSEEQEWLNKEFDKYIGMPTQVDEVNPTYVLKYFRLKALCRYVPEAKKLWFGSKPRPKDSIYLTWNGPPLKRCTCPYRECFCRGDVLEPKKIPWKLRCELNPLYYFQMMCGCPKSKPTTHTKEFFDRLISKSAAEEKRYQTMSKAGILQQMAPEICLLRCSHYLSRSNNRTTRYVPIGVKTKLKDLNENEDELDKKTEPLPAEIKEDEDNRICNTYSCTVSTQTDTGPDGKLDMGKELNVIFASIKDTVLPDIEGKKLQISPFEIECQTHDNQVYIRKIENLFNMNMKQIRCRLSKLISFIIEIKDPGVPVATRSTQIPSCNKACENFVTGKFKRNRSGLDESAINEINKFNENENQSSCVCCNAYKESFNNNLNDIRKEFIKDFVRQSN